MLKSFLSNILLPQKHDTIKENKLKLTSLAKIITQKLCTSYPNPRLRLSQFKKLSLHYTVVSERAKNKVKQEKLTSLTKIITPKLFQSYPNPNLRLFYFKKFSLHCTVFSKRAKNKEK